MAWYGRTDRGQAPPPRVYDGGREERWRLCVLCYAGVCVLRPSSSSSFVVTCHPPSLTSLQFPQKNNKENSKIVWISRLIYCLTFNRELWRVASYRTHFLRHTFSSLFGTPPPPCLSSSSHGGEGKSESSSAAICLFPEKNQVKKLPPLFFQIAKSSLLISASFLFPRGGSRGLFFFFFFAYSFSLTSAKKTFAAKNKGGGDVFFLIRLRG